MFDDGLVKRAFCAARRAYPAQPQALALPEEVARTEAIGYVGKSSVFYSGDLVAKYLPNLKSETLPSGPLNAAYMREAVTFGVTASEIMVAFRGTLPPGFKEFGLSGADWINDARAEMIPVKDRLYRVHRGFYFAMSGMWKAVKKQIDDLVAAHPGLPVCFTGHSKGGALAQIAAMLFKKGGGGVTVYVCTFASARTGDAEFVKAFDAAVDEGRRYEYGADIVPYLPPRSGEVAALLGMPPIEIAFLAGYQPAGDVYYLPMLPAGQVPTQGAAPVRIQMAASTQALAAIRTAATAQGITLPALSLSMMLRQFWVAENHDIAPGSGYDRWLFR